MPQTNQNQEPTINTPNSPTNFYELFEKGVLVNTTDLLKQTWRIFKNNWKKYIFLLLWLYVPLIAFGLLILTAVIILAIGFPNILSLFSSGLGFGNSGMSVSITAIFILAFLLFFFAYLSYVVNFALILHTHQIDQNLSIKELLKQSYKKVWGGIWVNILTGLIIFAGFLLLIVPGIIWSIKYSLATYVYLIEEKKGCLALKRSAEIVKGYWWSILKRYLIWVYFSIGLVLVLMFIPVINFFVNFATIILTPLGIIYFYSIYRNIKNLKDNGALSDNYKLKDKTITFFMAGGILVAIILFGGLMTLSAYFSKRGEIDQNNPKTNYYEDNWNYGNQSQEENNLDYDDGEDWSADESLQDDVY